MSTQTTGTKYPLNDKIAQITLIGSMGNDLSVVNDARTSYGKDSVVMGAKDVALIGYLLKHKHTSPFRGVVFKFNVTAPLFVARQWWKHTIASSYADEQRGWNEKSFRYTEVEDSEYYVPQFFRMQSAQNLQSSGSLLENPDQARASYINSCEQAFQSYRKLIGEGVSREIARAVLPNCTYTTFHWTVSLQSVLYFISLRDSDDAQYEIQQYAIAISSLIKDVVPYTMEQYEKTLSKETSNECFS